MKLEFLRTKGLRGDSNGVFLNLFQRNTKNLSAVFLVCSIQIKSTPFPVPVSQAAEPSWYRSF